MVKLKTTLLPAFMLFALVGGLFVLPTSSRSPVETKATANPQRYYFDNRFNTSYDDDVAIILQTYSEATGDVQHACTKGDDNFWYIDIDLTPYTGCKFAKANPLDIHEVYDYCEWDAKTGANYCFRNDLSSWWTTISSSWNVEGRVTLSGEWGTVEHALTHMRFTQDKGVEFYEDVHFEALTEFICHSGLDQYLKPDYFGRDAETSHQLDGYNVTYQQTFYQLGSTTLAACYGHDNNVIAFAEGDYRVSVFPVCPGEPEAWVTALSLNMPLQDADIYIRGTVGSLGLVDDWQQGMHMGHWTFGQGNCWEIGEIYLTHEDCFQFYIDGPGDADRWVGFDCWDGMYYDNIGFTTDEGGENIVPMSDVIYTLSVYEDFLGDLYFGQGNNYGAVFVNGKVDSLGIDPDGEKKSGPLFDLMGIYLNTSDHFRLSSGMFYHTLDIGWLAGDSLDLLVDHSQEEDYDLYVKENGYYDLEIVERARLIIRKSNVEPSVPDGFYIRGEGGNWDAEHQRKMTPVGKGRYVVGPLHLDNKAEIKAVEFRNGVPHWCQIRGTTAENYLYCAGDTGRNPSYMTSGNIQVGIAGDYYLVLTKHGSSYWDYHFVEPSKGYARHFLTSMVCDPTGVDEPDFGGLSWEQLKADFLSLNDEAKDIIFGSIADPNGNEIEEMLARYDLLVAGHGYEAFIQNSSGVYRHSVIPSAYAKVDNALPFYLIAIVVGGTTLFGLTLLVIRKKKKRDQR